MLRSSGGWNWVSKFVCVVMKKMGAAWARQARSQAGSPALAIPSIEDVNREDDEKDEDYVLEEESFTKDIGEEQPLYPRQQRG